MSREDFISLFWLPVFAFTFGIHFLYNTSSDRKMQSLCLHQPEMAGQIPEFCLCKTSCCFNAAFASKHDSQPVLQDCTIVLPQYSRKSVIQTSYWMGPL